MKQTLFIIAILFSLNGMSQTIEKMENLPGVVYKPIPLSSIVDSAITLPLPYKPAPQYDTIQVDVLITKCHKCKAKSEKAYAVREILIFNGDAVKLNGEPFFVTRKYLTTDMKPFPKSVTIWMSKHEESITANSKINQP